MNVNVRRGKYEGTTRVSEREKREKEGLIFKRDIQKEERGRDILLHRKTATKKEKKKEKNLSFLPPFPQKEKTHKYYFLPFR